MKKLIIGLLLLLAMLLPVLCFGAGLTDVTVRGETFGTSWTKAGTMFSEIYTFIETIDTEAEFKALYNLEWTDVQARDADLDDLADGTLSGSKLGTCSNSTGALPTTSGVTDGYVPKKQSDGTVAWEAESGGGGTLTSADLDTFSELNTIVADKTLVNLEDGATWLGTHDFTGATMSMSSPAFTALVDTDNPNSGLLITGLNAGATISKGQAVYFDATAGEWLLSDDDAVGKREVHGIAVTNGTDGNPLDIQFKGPMYLATWNWTIGQDIYLSATAGELTQTPDLLNSRRVGWAISATNIMIDIKGEYPIEQKEIVFDPKAVCEGTYDRILFMSVKNPGGVLIKGWEVKFGSDPATEADIDLKRADSIIGVENSIVMAAMDTTAGTASDLTYTNINSGVPIANGKDIYVEFGTPYTDSGTKMAVTLWFVRVR